MGWIPVPVEHWELDGWSSYRADGTLMERVDRRWRRVKDWVSGLTT
ncbi:MAG TPA: hypothetical protein VFN05_12095 [Actinomycetes bacterium]|nr:hypothetical protein [Actinomycetes bacterium]